MDAKSEQPAQQDAAEPDDENTLPQQPDDVNMLLPDDNGQKEFEIEDDIIGFKRTSTVRALFLDSVD